jgi:MFS family permease
MRRHTLAGLILASALVTLDGTATTLALPAIGHEFSASISRLQWIVNAPLLVLAAMLLPSGAIADRYGRVRVLRMGLAMFVASAAACAWATSANALVAAKVGQGVGGALILPAALATLRGAYGDDAERTRVFGVWAAWTGAASAAGPLLAGAIVDIWSWRGVFMPSMVAGSLAVVLLRGSERNAIPERPGPVPARATVALMLVLAALAYVLMQAAATGAGGAHVVIPVGVAIAGTLVVLRDRHRHVLFPRELLSRRNCLPANATTFALYFGMFGLSFLIVLYVQQVLRFSASWAAVVLLPMSIMLLFAERFGRLTASIGSRSLLVAGSLSAAGGIVWTATSGHPIPFWSHIVVGTGLFGFGVSLAVSALTHAAVAAVPETCAGAASGLNHAVVRAAGLVAVALLGSIAAPGLSDAVSADGVRRALILCAGIVASGGVAGGLLIRDEEPGGVAAAE